jgi:hypothetical protein
MLQLAVLAALIVTTMAYPVEESESYIRSSSGHAISHAPSLPQAPVQTYINGPVVTCSCSSVGTTCSCGGGTRGECLIFAENWTVRYNRVLFGEDDLYSARQDMNFFWYFGNKELYFVQYFLRSLEWPLLRKVPVVYEIIFIQSTAGPKLQLNSRFCLTRCLNFIFKPCRGFQASRYSGILFYALKQTRQNCNIYAYKV